MNRTSVVRREQKKMATMLGGHSSGECPQKIESQGTTDRLKLLYPFVNEEETPLPRAWSIKDKFTYIGLSNNNLRVHYRGIGKKNKDAASVRATHPIPASCGLYYFEVKIISKGRDGYMGVGLSAQGVNMNRLPGWDKHSYGYHGDDGHSFCSSGTGQPYGPTFTTGDVVGCGLNLVDNTCFYTKNGHHLGVAFANLPPNLYPTVGLQTPGEVVDANFGQQPFVFDIEDMIKELRIRTRLSIERFPVESSLVPEGSGGGGLWCPPSPQALGSPPPPPLPPSSNSPPFPSAASSSSSSTASPQGVWQSKLHRIVQTYLVHYGYGKTAEAFSRATGQPFHEDMTAIANRQQIQELVLSGQIGEAIATVESIYPGLLENNKNLLFMLKCRQFVEMINGTDTGVGGGGAPALRATYTSAHAVKKAPKHHRHHQSPKQQQQQPPDSGGVAALNGHSAEPPAVPPRSNATINSGVTTNNNITPDQDDRMDDGVELSNSSSDSGSSSISEDDVRCDGGAPTADDTTDIRNRINRTTTNGLATNGRTATTDDHMDVDSGDCGANNNNGALKRQMCAGDQAAIERMLQFGRELFALSVQLKQEFGSNETNKKMLQDAFGLLAYCDPWSSPVGYQLDPIQREPVCAALNSAILESQQLPRRPPLEVCVAHAKQLIPLMARAGLGACAFANVDHLLNEL